MNSIVLAGQQLTMSSQEIADLVESRHDSVKRTIERLIERKAIGLTPLVEVKNGQGQTVSVYQLEKRDTYVVVAQLSPEFTAALVDRWQELEAKQAKPAELSRMDILKLAMESEQARIEAEGKLALAAPKVQFFDKVVERDTLMSATQVAQKLGLSAVALNKHLDELDVYSKNIKRARVFKQWFIDKGLGELKQTELGYSQPLFTTAGEAWVVERLTSEGVVQ
jgi:phage regulator Rha-like protein